MNPSMARIVSQLEQYETSLTDLVALMGKDMFLNFFTLVEQHREKLGNMYPADKMPADVLFGFMVYSYALYGLGKHLVNLNDTDE